MIFPKITTTLITFDGMASQRDLDCTNFWFGTTTVHRANTWLLKVKTANGWIRTQVLLWWKISPCLLCPDCCAFSLIFYHLFRALMYFILKTFTIFLKMGHPRPFLSFIFSLFKQTVQFLQQCLRKTVHSVSGAVIRTHNLLDVSLLT